MTRPKREAAVQADNKRRETDKKNRKLDRYIQANLPKNIKFTQSGLVRDEYIGRTATTKKKVVKSQAMLIWERIRRKYRNFRNY